MDRLKTKVDTLGQYRNFTQSGLFLMSNCYFDQICSTTDLLSDNQTSQRTPTPGK